MTEYHAPIEYRMAETIDVRYPERIVQVMAMPYESPTSRVLHDGRQITEVVSRGAFAQGIEHRKNLRVFRDHDKTGGPVGKVVDLQIDRDDGLVADLWMSERHPRGQETLELAAEGLLDASVGFAPMENGERWSRDRRERRLNRVFLDHIALVPDPAYEDAVVLNVRSAHEAPEPDISSATPNLDIIRARLVELGIQLPALGV